MGLFFFPVRGKGVACCRQCRWQHCLNWSNFGGQTEERRACGCMGFEKGVWGRLRWLRCGPASRPTACPRPGDLLAAGGVPPVRFRGHRHLHLHLGFNRKVENTPYISKNTPYISKYTNVVVGGGVLGPLPPSSAEGLAGPPPSPPALPIEPCLHPPAHGAPSLVTITSHTKPIHSVTRPKVQQNSRTQENRKPINRHRCPQKHSQAFFFLKSGFFYSFF